MEPSATPSSEKRSSTKAKSPMIAAATCTADDTPFHRVGAGEGIVRRGHVSGGEGAGTAGEDGSAAEGDTTAPAAT